MLISQISSHNAMNPSFETKKNTHIFHKIAIWLPRHATALDLVHGGESNE